MSSVDEEFIQLENITFPSLFGAHKVVSLKGWQSIPVGINIFLRLC